MGDTLIRANELDAYTLTDEGTFWSYKGSLDLEILLRDNQKNRYSVIPINPERFSHINHAQALNLVAWITSPETQTRIAGFERNGHRLFNVGG
jgi:tungstate transport system substrate-binding protein